MPKSVDSKVVLLAAAAAIAPSCGKVDVLAGVEAAAGKVAFGCGRVIDGANPDGFVNHGGSFEVNAGDERCRCYEASDGDRVVCSHTVLEDGKSIEEMSVGVHGDVVNVARGVDSAGGWQEDIETTRLRHGGDFLFCAGRLDVYVGSEQECRDTNARVRATLRSVLARAKRR